MSFINLNNRNQVLNLPITSISNLTIQDVSDGIVTSSNGIISSISGIDTANLSDSLQTRLNTIESNVSSLGITDISGLQPRLSIIDTSLNALVNSGSSTVGISDVSGLPVKLSSVDASLNILSGISTLSLSSNSTNISNFAGSWSQLVNSPSDNGVGVACSGNGQYIIKLGWGASSYLSKDYGNTWSVVSILGSYMWAAAMSNNGQYILVTSIIGSSFLSSDYGANWSNISSVGTPNQPKISASGQFMILASNNGIYYSSNYGQSFTNWTDAGTNSWTSVAISLDGSTAVAVRATTTPTIWKTNNYGQLWTQIYSNPDTVSFGDIACSSDAKYILVALTQGQSGFMYISKDSGSTFSAVGADYGLSSSPYIRAAISSSGLYMMASCFSGFVFASSNYGETWRQTNVSSNGYFGLAMSSNASFAYLYVANTKILAYNSNVICLPVAQINTPVQGSVYFDQSANNFLIYNSLSSNWTTFNANLPTAPVNTPVKGSSYFDQSANKLYVYNSLSSSWKSVSLT
jgi:hypothetical protein